MESQDLIRKMLDAVNESYQPDQQDKKRLDEMKVEIEVEGPEADALLARLMQLAGTPDLEHPTADVHADVPVVAPVDPGIEAPLPVSIDEPPMPAGDSKYVCDACGESQDVCMCNQEEGAVCEQCGLPEGVCECGMSVSKSGPLMGMTMENADHDFGHQDVQDEGEPVDVDTYVYKPPQMPQRMVKGVMGDNPMMTNEGMAHFKSLVDRYVSYLNESDMPNEDGQASPLTASDRDEFDRDPSSTEEPVTDGSHSPMTDIKRQDVMK